VTPEIPKLDAVIYCRTASVVGADDALAGQEARCREYALKCGYEVLDVFRDVTSGASTERAELTRLLACIEGRQGDSIRVIVDDIAVLARSVQAHIAIREAIKQRGASLVSPSFSFGDDTENRLVEHLTAATNQFQTSGADQESSHKGPFKRALHAVRRRFE
jgi:DNA invertase Pin-like site-specific DNA recombinase